MLVKILRYVMKFIPVLLSTILTFFSIFSVSLDKLETEIEEQNNRIIELEEKYASNKEKFFDESSLYMGDLETDLKNGVKFNELSFIATHNSYQTPALDEFKKLYKNLSQLTFGAVNSETAEFYSETLTDQLNSGLRSFELDIETFDRDGEVSFTCMHFPYLDMTTSCYDFSLALKEIAMWSDYNPDHLPITIIIEPKSVFLPLKDMKFFNIDYAKKLETTIRDTLKDKLFTPADMLRSYESFGEMRKADDWCRVEDMLGKVVILLHECKVTEGYIAIDSSVKSQAMFPMLKEKDIDRDCTSFILCNDPERLLKLSEEIKARNIMVRTRADEFGSISEKQREQAFLSDANIISTDYPVRTDLKENDYFVSFSEFATVRKSK